MPKYARGEKVFAKVRGYPPWPARVEGVADETPNKMKYHIYFYGTAETAICKADELFPYVENRAKYGKPLKKRGFNEALQQVDEELGLTGTNFLENSATEDSIADTSVTRDEASVTSVGNTSKDKPETPKSVRRKFDVQDSVEHEANRLKNNTNKKFRNSTDQSQTPVTGKQQEVVSRSGRKIKPKKFADEQVDDNSGSTYAVTTNHSTSIASATAMNKTVDDTSVVSNNEVKNTVSEQKLSAGSTTESGEKINKEKEEKTKREEKSKEEPQETEKKDGKSKLSTTKQNDNSGTEELLPESLRIEVELLRLDTGIKDCLDFKIAYPLKALKYLDDLLQLKQINSLMFKKHPEIVDTMTKLCKYVGCVQNWNMTDDEVNAFNEKAAQIQEKARKMLEKIKLLFEVPEDQPFNEYFNEVVNDFNNVTKEWPQEDILKLLIDPTEEKEN